MSTDLAWIVFRGLDLTNSTTRGTMYILGSVLALSALSFCATTETNSPQVEAAPSITAHRLTSPPIIDGKLLDDCWREAEVASDFWRSDGSSRANPSASVQLVFDDENLYVGFRCPLSDPQSVTNQPDQMFGRNTALVFLDPLLDHRRDVGLAADPDALFTHTLAQRFFDLRSTLLTVVFQT